MTYTDHYILTGNLQRIAKAYNIEGDDWLERLHALHVKMKFKWQWPSDV